MLSIPVLIAIIGVLFLAFVSIRKALRPSFKKLPGGLPWVGHLFSIDPTRAIGQFEEWEEKTGDLFELSVLGQRIIITSRKDICHNVQWDRPWGYKHSEILKTSFRECAGDGVFIAEGDEWKKQRTVMIRALTKIQIGKQFSCILDSLKAMLVEIKDKELEHTLATYGTYTMNATASYMMDRQIDPVLDKDWLEDLPVVLDYMAAILRNPLSPILANIPFTKQNILRTGARRWAEKIKALSMKQRESALADFASGKPFRVTFFHNLVDPNAEEQLSEMDVFGNFATVLLAGVETTAESLTWATYYLTLYPQWQERIKAEFDRVVPDMDTMTFAQFEQLVETRAFYDELSRVQPGAPLNDLSPVNPTTIDGIPVNPADMIVMLNRKVQSREYPHPEFDPDRWLKPSSAEEQAKLLNTIVTFGEGPRICPGRNLAIIMAVTCLGAICSKYKIEYLGSGPVVEQPRLMVSAKKVHVRFQSRL